METGSVTSKTSSIKALLLRGWYECWTDIQWGISIKTILPRGVSGDVYNLADVIIQQALVGNAPNELLLSFLKHSLSSQLISYAAVLSTISKYDALDKHHCIKWLLTFLDNISEKITCRSKPEETALPTALLSTILWLLQVYNYSLKESVEINELTTKPLLILDKLFRHPFTFALIYVSTFEDKDTYKEIAKNCLDIQQYLESKSITHVDSVDIFALFQGLNQLEAGVKLNLPEYGNNVDFCIQTILLITVLLNPTTDTQTFVNHLLTVQQLKGYSNSKLYMHFVKGCFINLNEALKEEEDSQWGAFVYAKVPTIIQKLSYYYHGSSHGPYSEKASQEILQSFLSLMEYSPLLHTLDLRTSCSNIEILLDEMVNIRIISDDEKNQILLYGDEIWRRNKYHKVSRLEEISSHPSGSIPTAILHTGKPALARIMKTLDTELENIQEALLNILNQFINGKSYEVILALAAVSEVLQTFVMKLIKVNELCQQINSSDGKSAYTKSMLFDITFLILSSIVQRYGSKIIFGNRWGNSFFENWVEHCMVEQDNNKAMIALVKGHNPEKVKLLMAWFDSNEFDIRNVPMKWGDVCLTMPAVMKEIHDSWSSKLGNVDVKKKLDAIRSCQMYSLSVCSISWLSSYMQILSHEELLKPRNMVQQFLNPPCDDVSSSSSSLQSDLRNQSMKLTQHENPRDSRCWLALNIMCKIQYSVGPSMMPIKLFNQFSNCILSKESIYKQLLSIWLKVFKQGSLSLQLVQDMKTVFNVTETNMFIKFMIEEVLKQRYKRELNRAVDLLFGLFYFDIEECSTAFLTYIPYLLLLTPSGCKNNDLIEPQSSVIARLVAYSIFAPARCYSNFDFKSEPGQQEAKEYSPPTKMMKMSIGDDTIDLTSEMDDPEFRKCPNPTFSSALLNAIDVMFEAFDGVTCKTSVVTQNTYFIVRVLEQIVLCGKSAAKPILARLPSNLVPKLIRLVPELFSMNLILNLYPLNTPAGRKSAVRDLCLLQNLTVRMEKLDKYGNLA